MFRFFFQKYFSVTILLTSLITISEIFNLPFAFTLFLEIIIVFSFFSLGNSIFKKKEISKVFFFVSLYVGYNFISICRGLFISDIYWDYKNLLVNGLALLLPIIALPSMSQYFVSIVLRFYLRKTMPLIVLFFSYLSYGAVGFFLVPISFLGLFIPIIKGKWKYIILIISLFIVFIDFAARSNVIKFLVPILFSFIYFFRRFAGTSFFKSIRVVLLALPFFLFVAGITDYFNVFKINEYVDGSYNQKKINRETGEEFTEDLTADTRTFLYTEVLLSVKKNNYWIFGRSPARGNETEQFGEVLIEATGRNERASNEVAILNVFTWTGIIGVFLLFLVYYHASYLSIYKSNNIFSKILGLYLCFRWCYAWVEDINHFTLTTYMLWLTIGVTLSTFTRKMSNQEFIFWVNSFFSINIYNNYKTYINVKNNKKRTIVSNKSLF